MDASAGNEMIDIAPGQVTLSDRRTQRSWPVELAPYQLAVWRAEVYGTYRVLPGGGLFDQGWSCRASVRRRSHPTFQIDDVGFRIARSIVA